MWAGRPARGAEARDALAADDTCTRGDGHRLVVVVGRPHAVRVAQHDDVATPVVPPAGEDDRAGRDGTDRRPGGCGDVDPGMGAGEAGCHLAADRQGPQVGRPPAPDWRRRRFRCRPGGRSRRRLRCCLGHRVAARHPDHATHREGVCGDPGVPTEDCRELHAVPAGDVPERVPGTNPMPRTRGRCRTRRLGRRNRGLRLDEPWGRGRRDGRGRRAGPGRHDDRRECCGRKDGRRRGGPRGDGLLHRGCRDDRDEDGTAGGKDAGAVGRIVVRPQERVPPSAGASARRMAGGGRDPRRGRASRVPTVPWREMRTP